jgi:hypothetical protein
VVVGGALGDVEVGAGLGVEEADHLGARLDVRAHQPLLQNVPGQRHDVGDGLFCAVRDADPGHERVVRDPDVAARRAAKALPGTSGETEAPFAAAVWPVRVRFRTCPHNRGERGYSPPMSAQVDDTLWNEFHRVVNMTSRELQDWLRTDAAGPDAEVEPEHAGTPSGQEVLDILRKRRADLTEHDADRMQRVVDRVLAERRDDLEPTAGQQYWRRRMMRMGHDPLKPV